MSDQEFILKRLDIFLNSLDEVVTAFHLASKFCPDPWSDTLYRIYNKLFHLHTDLVDVKRLVEQAAFSPSEGNQSGAPYETSD